MNSDEILVITPQIPMSERDVNYVRELILKQKEEGVVILPFGYKVLIKPRDIEIELGPDKDENRVIHNAVSYICMADKNHHGATADQIAKVLYDRAYRKGFEAGKKEGTVKIKEVEVPEKHYTSEEIDGWNGGGA